MSVLAIDTSARRRCVCVIAGTGGELICADVRTDTDLDSALPLALAGLLDDRVDAIVVVVGPGSYTGVRGGMAAALGVAHARGLRLHGVGTLDVVAAGAHAQGAVLGWAVAAAGRGGLYAIRFGPAAGEIAAEPIRVALADFDPEDLPVFSIDAVPLARLHPVDPAPALARAAAAALAGPPLSAADLRAVYVE